jgi:hypothetical protein
MRAAGRTAANECRGRFLKMISIFASVVWAAATAISGDVDRLDEIDALRRQVQGQLEERDCHSHHMIGGFR